MYHLLQARAARDNVGKSKHDLLEDLEAKLLSIDLGCQHLETQLNQAESLIMHKAGDVIVGVLDRADLSNQVPSLLLQGGVHCRLDELHKRQEEFEGVDNLVNFAHKEGLYFFCLNAKMTNGYQTCDNIGEVKIRLLRKLTEVAISLVAGLLLNRWVVEVKSRQH